MDVFKEVPEYWIPVFASQREALVSILSDRVINFWAIFRFGAVGEHKNISRVL